MPAGPQGSNGPSEALQEAPTPPQASSLQAGQQRGLWRGGPHVASAWHRVTPAGFTQVLQEGWAARLAPQCLLPRAAGKGTRPAGWGQARGAEAPLTVRAGPWPDSRGKALTGQRSPQKGQGLGPLPATPHMKQEASQAPSAPSDQLFLLQTHSGPHRLSGVSLDGYRWSLSMVWTPTLDQRWEEGHSTPHSISTHRGTRGTSIIPKNR